MKVTKLNSPFGGAGGGQILLAHPGTQYSYALAAQLNRLGLLYQFATCLAFGDDEPAWIKWLPDSWQKQRKRRTVAGVPLAKLWRKPWLEIEAMIQIKKGKSSQKVFFHRNEKFQQQIPDKLLAHADLVIGFDTSSWILQQRCRQLGKPFILDASIAHPLSQQQVFQQIAQRFPLWAGQLPSKDPKLIAIEQQEMQEADHIVVASAFTKKTYMDHGVAANKISINHYGTDTSAFIPRAFTPGNRQPATSNLPSPELRKAGQQPVTGNRPPVFLFFGSISARKGFPWLCEVWERFHQQYPGSRLIAAGYGAIPDGFQLPAGIELTGFVHPKDRLALFHRADVFVFPSFFEGFAQVIIEAMACGLPVISTTATVGPEIIDNGKQGYCMAPGEDEALLQALVFFAAHPQHIAPMGHAARQAVEALSWEAYGDRWGAIIGQLMGTVMAGGN